MENLNPQSKSSIIVRQPPPSLHFELSQLPSTLRGPGYDSVNPALEELRQYNRLTICSPGRVDEILSHINVQDQTGRNIFTIQVQAAVPTAGTKARVTYTVYDNSGSEVMSIDQEKLIMHLTIQGCAIGSVQNLDSYGTTFTISTATNDFNFHIEGDHKFGLTCFPCCTHSDFKIISETQDFGSMIGQNMPNGKCVCLTFPPNTNPNAKVLLLFTGIRIFIDYFGRTKYGRTGLRGAKCSNYFCCMCFCRD